MDPSRHDTIDLVPGPASVAARPAEGRYRERLTVPWWSHPLALAIGALIGAESSFLAGGLRAQAVVVGVFALAFELVVWAYGRQLVEVADGHVRAGDWRLPVSQVRGVAVLTREQARAELRRRDDSVYRCTRGWIPGAVLLDVDDPQDLPLWLVSTRRPDALALALADASLAPPSVPGGLSGAGPVWPVVGP